MTSDTCHGSTISSADCLWKLNHAQKVGQLYRSSEAGLRFKNDSLFTHQWFKFQFLSSALKPIRIYNLFCDIELSQVAIFYIIMLVANFSALYSAFLQCFPIVHDSYGKWNQIVGDTYLLLLSVIVFHSPCLCVLICVMPFCLTCFAGSDVIR